MELLKEAQEIIKFRKNTRKGLAKLSGISTPTLEGIEKGTVTNEGTLLKVIKRLGE